MTPATSERATAAIALIGAGAISVLLTEQLDRSQRDEESTRSAAVQASPEASTARGYDPLAIARASVGRTRNAEASVPPQCYTKTAGVSNPCFTCHTSGHGTNQMNDWQLQQEYSFSDTALQNHWSNLFVDRRDGVAGISDDEILRWIRQDNYGPLRIALARSDTYLGYRPDLDLDAGFDDDGFARDRSGWRALRYKPFSGTFWPTNGSSDDVFVRLPPDFRITADGADSRAIYRTNLALLEAALSADPETPRASLRREIEPIDERVSGIDLDGDGRLGTATSVRGLPARYAGAAGAVSVRIGVNPYGTEYLHTVRYVDPDAPGLLSRRLKELRYSRKREELDTWATTRAYEREQEEKQEGRLPIFAGNPEVGYQNSFGWQLQGFIEDELGRLRAQTEEEHRFCMGCHSTIGGTVDHVFAMPRKVPGQDGWRHQDLVGIRDVPQLGHREPEIVEYFRRVGGGDELRANQEVLARFFPDGQLDEKEARRAAPGGDRDITHLVAPSRARALLLDKAYRLIVAEQSFARGRDAVVAPVENVHTLIENGSTELGRAGRVFTDGRLLLAWDAPIVTASTE